jgi:phage shock protein C
MKPANQSLFARNDTMFGVCEAIGEDFGFNPNWLRVVLGVMLLWNPVVVIGAYALAGVAVMMSRLIFPKARSAQADTQLVAA